MEPKDKNRARVPTALESLHPEQELEAPNTQFGKSRNKTRIKTGHTQTPASPRQRQHPQHGGNTTSPRNPVPTGKAGTHPRWTPGAPTRRGRGRVPRALPRSTYRAGDWERRPRPPAPLPRTQLRPVPEAAGGPGPAAQSGPAAGSDRSATGRSGGGAGAARLRLQRGGPPCPGVVPAHRCCRADLPRRVPRVRSRCRLEESCRVPQQRPRAVSAPQRSLRGV